MNAFTILKHFQPSTGSTIRQQVFKAFRLELVQGLIGNYNSRQCYALPPALRDAAHNFTSAPAKRRRNEGDTTVPTLEAHFPTKGSTGCCCYCWNVKGRRHDSCVRCRRCGKALCIINWDSPVDGDRSTGDGDPSTGDGDRSTGDGDRSAGDGDQSTGDGDRLTGDGDRWTGDGDRLTGDGGGD